MLNLLGKTSIERKFGVHYIFSRAWFLGNFWVIYLVSKGFSLVDAAYLDFVFWGTLLIFEIPTGYVADLFGRKTSVFLSLIFQVVGVVLFAIANTFPEFLLSYGVWGFALTLQSGAEEAWIYDEITHHFGNDEQYQSIFGRLIGIGFISSAVSGIAAGFIARISLLYTIYATAVVFFIAAIWLLTIPHNRRQNVENEDRSIRASLRAIPEVKYLAALMIIVNSAMLVIIFWFQVYLDDRSVDYILIGLILSLGSIFVSVGGKFSERISDRLGVNTIVILPVILSGLIIFMSIRLYTAIIGYWLIHIFQGLWYPLHSKLINEKLPTATRATSLSIIGAMGTIAIVSAELGSAIIIENRGYDYLFVIMSALTFLLVSIIVAIAKSRKSLIS